MNARCRARLAGTTVLLLVAARAACAQVPAAPPRPDTVPVEVDSGCLAPVYPMILKMAGVSGRITLSYEVDSAGVVDSATIRVITTSHDLLVRPARHAALSCRYRPVIRNGVPVRARILRRFSFVAPVN